MVQLNNPSQAHAVGNTLLYHRSPPSSPWLSAGAQRAECRAQPLLLTPSKEKPTSCEIGLNQSHPRSLALSDTVDGSDVLWSCASKALAQDTSTIPLSSWKKQFFTSFLNVWGAIYNSVNNYKKLYIGQGCTENTQVPRKGRCEPGTWHQVSHKYSDSLFCRSHDPSCWWNS